MTRRMSCHVYFDYDGSRVPVTGMGTKYKADFIIHFHTGAFTIYPGYDTYILFVTVTELQPYGYLNEILPQPPGGHTSALA